MPIEQVIAKYNGESNGDENRNVTKNCQLFTKQLFVCKEFEKVWF